MSKSARVDREAPVRGNVRIPVASNRAPLVYRGLDTKNFYHRWVADKNERIAMFIEAGYEFVKPNKNMVVGDPTVDTTSVTDRVKKAGSPPLYLMRQPIEWYNEDQAAKQLAVDELEATMRRPGTGKAVGPDVDYGSIKMERNNVLVPNVTSE